MKEKLKNFFRMAARSQKGQTLILGVLAMIIILVGILVLFDVQNTIRGKVKVMSGIDSAALTGAVWQKHTLNLIGELNLVRATSVIITDITFGIEGNPETYQQVIPDNPLDPASVNAAILKAEAEHQKLNDVSSMLTQMQARISFVGPLIGFGAAQQAAKNNGITYNSDCTEYVQGMYSLVLSDSYYGNPDIAPQIYQGYAWRIPYANMLQEILTGGGGYNVTETPKGIAVGTMVEHLGRPILYSDPPSNPDFTSYLQSRIVYNAIAAKQWCILRSLIRMQYNQKWWGNLKVRPNSQFLGESEILPVHIEFFTGEDPYGQADSTGSLDAIISTRTPAVTKLKEYYTDTYDPVQEAPDGSGNKVVRYDGQDTDFKYYPLPDFTWAIYDENKWMMYSDEYKDYWGNYLTAPFKEGMDYFSGALSYFAVQVPNSTMTGKYKVGKSLAFGGKDKTGYQINYYAQKVKDAESQMNTASEISFDALAKPIGYIETQSHGILPPHASKMVLPVFKDAAIIPVSLETPSGISMADMDWVIFLTKYLPALGNVSSLSDMQSQLEPEDWSRVTWYHNQLLKLDDPTFRAEGIAWLEAVATRSTSTDALGNVTENVTTNEDHCDDWGGGSGGGRSGPGKLH